MFIKRLLLIKLFFIFLFSPTVFAAKTFGEQPEVKKFIAHMVHKYHFNENELLNVFNAVELRPAVISSIKAPLEKNPWYKYQSMFLTEERIREGVNFWNKHKATLERAHKTFGVPPEIIVATIGVETKYGKNKGEYRVIDALTNLAFGRTSRAPYFRKELEEFLLLSREKHLNPLHILGSYAGAIGQPQFMPSSYRNYAINFSGSGKIDLSNNVDDVIGSIANYYQKHGWKTNKPVAIPANVKGIRYYSLTNKKKSVQVGHLSAYGIFLDGFADDGDKAKLIRLEGANKKEYWVSFHNFDVIKQYNTSTLYAMAVYQLGEYITAVKGRSA
jgi:membrane-bound lytic murein transglycosylase B